jgi:hypothetical protein
VDCCCANSKLDARSTKAEHPDMVAARMYAPSTRSMRG